MTKKYTTKIKTYQYQDHSSQSQNSLSLAQRIVSTGVAPSLAVATPQFVSISLQPANSCLLSNKIPVRHFRSGATAWSSGWRQLPLVDAGGQRCMFSASELHLTQGHNSSSPLLHAHSRLYFTNQQLLASSPLARSLGRQDEKLSKERTAHYFTKTFHKVVSRTFLYKKSQIALLVKS